MINFTEIWSSANHLARDYNLDAKVFITVYLLSFIPFYLGYFLIIYGSTREMHWRDIFRFKLGKLKWNNESKAGLFIHLFGRAMPYAYIIFFGQNLPLFVYIFVAVLFFIPFFNFIRKAYSGFIRIRNRNHASTIIRKEIVDDMDEADSFLPINKITPCKQSLDREHFHKILRESSAIKYLVLQKESNQLIGMGIITNKLKNSPWISEEYFKTKFPEKFSQQLVYYFMGLAICDEHRREGHSLALIERIIDDLPPKSVLGFDHSNNVNPFLYYFTHIVKQARFLKREILILWER